MSTSSWLPAYMIDKNNFLGIKNSNVETEFVVFGVPFDITVSGRPGCRFGPDAIRKASLMLADGANPDNWGDPKQLHISDIGNIELVHGNVEASLNNITEAVSKIEHPIALGGDHLISLGILRELRKRYDAPLSLIHFDAHIDTWPNSYGLEYSHGSVFYHAIKEELVDPKRMIQIGIRSPVEKQFYDWTKNQGVNILNFWNVNEYTPYKLANIIRKQISHFDEMENTPTYLTFDVDCLDPSYAPGVGTPVVGGLTTSQAINIIRNLKDINFVGMDLVEVCPPYDVGEITALAGATIVWEYLSLIEATRKELIEDIKRNGV